MVDLADSRVNSMHFSAKVRIFASVFALSLALARTSAAVTITNMSASLASLGTKADATAINANGQVTGFYVTSVGYQRSFLYTPGSGAIDIGTLGGGDSNAYALNNLGQVTGYSDTASGGNYAYVYTPGTGLTNLGTLGLQSRGFGINDSGMVAGENITNAGPYGAFLYTPGAGMTSLGTLGGSTSYAYAINQSGVVAGTSTTAGDAATHVFVYTQGTGMVDIGALGANPVVAGINASGQVVGTSAIACVGNNPCTNTLHPFLYTPGSGMADLGTFDGEFTIAGGVNDLGWVVGSSYIAGQNVAFLYKPGIGLINLNTLISPSLGWQLDSASGINNLGQIIGTGFGPDGHEDAFVLDLQATATPEPASLLLSSGGIALLAFALKRKTRQNC